MKDIVEETRLSNFVLKEQKKTSSAIESQFPAIYRENGAELVELVKEYYRFLEEDNRQSTHNIRRIYEYRNIDSTAEKMLIFFKNKFLNGLFFEEDIRFAVKNILDLYRRKGSKEGIELFFKLFFDEEVQTYFPSQDIFKPSTSRWQVGSYIQLYGVTDTSIFDSLINVRIFGDKSKAEGTIDNIVFINVNNSAIPIIFLDNVKGEFTRFDNIYSLNPLTFYGRVYGSLRSVSIDATGPGTGGNKIGDIVEIRSDVGFGAKGLVTSVTEQISGEISFRIEDGNYGYTTSNTDILVSEQSIFFAGGVGSEFIVNERIKQSKANTDVFATVLGKRSDSIGIFLDYRELTEQVLFVPTDGNEFNPSEQIVQTNSYGVEVFATVEFEEEGFIVAVLDKTKPDVATQRYFFEKNFPIETIGRAVELQKPVLDIEDDYFFEDGIDVQTVGRTIGSNITRSPLFVTLVNNSARAEIGSIKNTETIRIIGDLIESFLDVPLDANNYSEVPPAIEEMSGTRINDIIPDLDTPLNEAFVPEEFVIGEIGSLSNINPGVDHVTDVFVLARENLLSKFNIRNQVMTVSVPAGVLLFVGDIVQQTRTVSTFEGGTEVVQVRGKIISVVGNQITVKHHSFGAFVSDEPIFKEGTSIAIAVISIQRDLTNPPLGLNAIIGGNVEDVVGKIESIDVTDSGFGYEQGSVVDIVNVSKENNNETNIVGIASVSRQGITEGRWRTFESQTNREKVIQDSFFYQAYSYQITTGLNTSQYEDEYRNIVHPAGLKLFTQFGKTDVINIIVNTPQETIDQFSEIVIDAPDVFQANNDFIYLVESTE